MQIQSLTVLRHAAYASDYRILVLDAPEMSAVAQPGQFLHVQIPRLDAAALRRPFSIYRAGHGELAVLYKPVGRGTQCFADVREGDKVSVIGPLGHGFPPVPEATFPVLVAGGYGVAPLSLLASRTARRGVVFVGGRQAVDILCVEDFRDAGWEVHVTTQDGSLGAAGLVTDALDGWLARHADPADPSRLVGGTVGALPCRPTLCACGPSGLLKAVSNRAVARGWEAWISLDNHMGCGVGACLVCVQRIREADGSIVWKRTCREGPVFRAETIVWDEKEACVR